MANGFKTTETLAQNQSMALTSTQDGVTATYTYTLAPAADGAEVTLDAECTATGLWKLVHPLIVLAMKKADASQIASLRAAMDCRGRDRA